MFETALLGLFKLIQSEKNWIGTTPNTDKQLPRGVFYLKWLIPCVLLLIGIYFVLVFNKTGSYAYNPWDEKVLLVLLSCWGLSTILTRKYTAPIHQNPFYELAPYVKSGLLMLLFNGIAYYFLRLDDTPRFFIFGTSALHSTIEVFAFFLYFFGGTSQVGKSQNRYQTVDTDTFGQEHLDDAKILKSESKTRNSDLLSLFSRISIPYIKEIFKFISESILPENHKTGRTKIFNTISLTNIVILKSISTSLLINFHKLNDIRRLNIYFLNCHDKISSGGILVGCFEDLDQIRTRLRSRMPRFLFISLYPLHFVFYRVFPKLPVTKRIYFILTKGEKRVFSKTEIFGRLSFCGFELLQERAIGNKTYFICKKVKTVSTEKDPSYGLIVRLKRIGLKKEIISVYKIRTMYPYSEFIQKDIYDKFNLNNSGKLKNDYRLTYWGKILRRFFIDEIPQIYNWIRGDLKLIGVRALSEHYFGLYPKDMQELRVKSKPGLIPPYYVDIPRSFNEIIESEKKYLRKYSEKPFSTNIIYLIRALYNIVFKGARSK